MIIERDDTIISLLEQRSINVDEIVDVISGMRLIHLAVLMNYEPLVDFLINNDAHLMARDYNGYTPLLKAASLNRLSIIKKLIDAGVPVSHKDPWGNTPLDKALLYQHRDTVEYINSLKEDINSEKIGFWRNKEIAERFPFTIWILKYYNKL
jgi:ankyrin repeat protein